MPPNKNNLIGQKFNMLTVIAESPIHRYIDKNGKRATKTTWLCKCECGNEKIIIRSALGKLRSCGCTRNGLTHTKLGAIHRSMIFRCYNEKCDRYKDYGQRGITICDEWLHNPLGLKIFYDWSMNNGYEEGLSIDRIDVNGNYEPSNCRWATDKVQAINKRNSKIV